MKKINVAIPVVSLSLIFGFSVLPMSLRAADQGGTSTAAFLRLGQGARVEGMGGAFTAVGDDAHTIHFNPAGLAQITRRQVALDHVEFIEKINSQYAAFVLPVNALGGSMGVDVSYVDMGSIERRDATGDKVSGKTDSNAYAATLAWGQAVGDRLAIGASGKMFKENLVEEALSGYAMDAGGLFSIIPNRLMIGVSALNIGPKVKIGTTNESLPLTFRGGVAYHPIPKKLLLTADAEKERDTDAVMHVGGEYIYQNRFIGRAGYRDPLGGKGGWSAGVGFIWRPMAEGSSDFFGKQDRVYENDSLEVRIDYAFVDYGDFDATHRFGVHLAF